LVGDVAGDGVGGEIHHERAHEGAAILGDVSGDRVNVGQQAVAEAVDFEHGFVGFAFFTSKLPHFSQGVFAVGAHKGTKAENWSQRVLSSRHSSIASGLLRLVNLPGTEKPPESMVQ
jgi:hypothetical protein